MRVRLDATKDTEIPLMVEGDGTFERETGLHVEDVLITPAKDGITQLVVTNFSGFMQTVQEGVLVGEVQPPDILESDLELDQVTGKEAAYVRKLSKSREQWKNWSYRRCHHLTSLQAGA